MLTIPVSDLSGVPCQRAADDHGFSRKWELAALAAILAALAPAPGRSDEPGVQDKQGAAIFLERGEIRPLEEILASLAVTQPGEVVAIDLEKEDGRWVYELKIVTRRAAASKSKSTRPPGN